jgi:hypothetical protein
MLPPLYMGRCGKGGAADEWHRLVYTTDLDAGHTPELCGLSLTFSMLSLWACLQWLAGLSLSDLVQGNLYSEENNHSRAGSSGQDGQTCPTSSLTEASFSGITSPVSHRDSSQG